MKTFYIKLDADGYIWDCVSYQPNDYIETKFNDILPDKFIALCYKFLGNDENGVGRYERDEERYLALQ